MLKMAGVHGKRRNSVFGAAVFLLAAAILALSGSLLRNQADEKRRYQFIAELEKIEYNEGFLEEIQKMQGILQVYPVREIPVRLKIKDYTMDTVVTAVDIEVFDKKVEKAQAVSLGNTPVLFLGKDSLAGMADSNGHPISQEQQRRFLEEYDSLEPEYFVTSDGADEGAGEETQGKSCIVAGVFSSPAAGIYLPYEQSEALCKNSGGLQIKKALITVQGRENYEKVRAALQAGLILNEKADE